MFNVFIACDEQSPWRSLGYRAGTIPVTFHKDSSKALEGDQHDVIVLTNALDADARQTGRLLDARKHVLYCGEPTFAKSAFDALNANAAKNSVRFIMANPDRFLPSRQLIRQQIPEKLGPAGLIRIHRWECAGAVSATALSLPPPLLRDLDMTLWLADCMPDRVFAIDNAAASARSLQVHLGFPNGSMALIDYDNRSPHVEGYQSLSVIGTSGAAHADDHPNMQIVFRPDGARAVRTGEGVKQFGDLLRWFVESIASDQELNENKASWQRVFTVAAAVEQALSGKQAVPVG